MSVSPIVASAHALERKPMAKFIFSGTQQVNVQFGERIPELHYWLLYKPPMPKSF
jgi:hypothetical protein